MKKECCINKTEVPILIKFLAWFLVFGGILLIARSLRIYPGTALPLFAILPLIGQVSIFGFFAYVVTLMTWEGAPLAKFPYAALIAMALSGLILFFIAFGLSRMRKWAFHTIAIFIIFDAVTSILFRRPLNFVVSSSLLFFICKKRNLFT